MGSHGAPGNGPDPLFTQGAVKASAAGNIVATVNAGSNTLSVFNIDPKDPTNLEMIGKPVGSGGEFPVSLAINKAGNSVCTVNGGAINGVA
jgi:6-phosphogluconolactonase (cycloisomerase 2 family)